MRIGIVGCGEMGVDAARLYRIMPGCRVTACADVDIHRARLFGGTHRRARVFDSAEELFRSGVVDVAYAAVPHYRHDEVIRFSLDAGVPLLMDKPFTIEPEKGMQFVVEARERGAILAVNHQYRFDEGCRQLVRLCREGEFGEILYVRISVPWRRETTYFKSAGWRGEKSSSGGGTLITQASHALDIGLLAIGESAESVYAATERRIHRDVEVEDLVALQARFPGGRHLQLAGTMASGYGGMVSVEVIGTQGWARWTGPVRSKLRYRGKNRRGVIRGFQTRSFFRSFAEFCHSVRRGRSDTRSVETALAPVVFIRGAYRSAETDEVHIFDEKEKAWMNGTPSSNYGESEK